VPRYAAQIRITAKIELHFSFYLCNVKRGKKPGGLAQYASRKSRNMVQIAHCLFMVVLHRPFRAPKAHVLFAGVCLYLCLVVEVAVVVAVVAVLF